MSLLFIYVSFFACIQEEIDCENHIVSGMDYYGLYLGAQNSAYPRGLSLRTSMTNAGSLLNGYSLSNQVFFYQETFNQLAIYVSDTEPSTTQLESLGTDVDFYNDLTDLGDLIALVEGSESGYAVNSIQTENNDDNFIDVHYLDRDRFVTYVVPAGVSARIDVNFGVTHCDSSNYMDIESNSQVQLEEFWAY
jgi:hypothetical protein